MNNIKSFILKYSEFFTIFGLSCLFYFIFFHNIGSYALMDVDETRYVLMSKDMFNSKDFLTLYLNGDYFFEKPPLYFWLECLSFAIFGKINEFTARFPVAMCGTMCCFMTYFLGRKIVSRKYGIISSLILATSLEFVILSKFAILDIVVSTCIWFSVSFGILTLFTDENKKKYFWWLFYIFSGLAVMAKGIPGFIIPFGSMFFIYLFSKKLKEIFKPVYCLTGIILFLLMVLPWHIIMLNMYDPLFFNEYVIKHHISRFFGGDVLGRKQPFYFYILTILWGFMPWIISTLSVLVRKLVKRDFNFRNLTSVKDFLIYMGIYSVFTFLFFSSSDTKLITYILPIYPALALLGGYIWLNYIERGEYETIINKTVYVTGAVFMLASVAALFTPYFLPAQLNSDIADVKIFAITLLFCIGLFSILFAINRKYSGVFFTYILFIMLLSAFGTGKIFNLDYKFGQQELVEFAQYAKEHSKDITCYKFGRKYSMIYYGNIKADFHSEYTPDDLKKELQKTDRYVVVRIKHIKDLDGLKHQTLKTGRKYILTD